MCTSFHSTLWTEMRVPPLLLLMCAKHLFSIFLAPHRCVCILVSVVCRRADCDGSPISSNYKTLTWRLSKWKSNDVETVNEMAMKRIQVNSFHLHIECNRKFYDVTRIHRKLTRRIVCESERVCCASQWICYSFAFSHYRLPSSFDMLDVGENRKKKFSRYFCHPLDARFQWHCVNLLQCTSSVDRQTYVIFTWHRRRRHHHHIALSYFRRDGTIVDSSR